MNTFQRIQLLIRRHRAARNLGVKFFRQRTFDLPECLQLPNGQRLCFPKDQPSITHDFVNIILDDEYGIKRLNSPPSTVLDIGANIGLFTWFASQTWPDAKIFAFEPNSLAFQFALQNAGPAKLVQSAI